MAIVGAIISFLLSFLVIPAPITALLLCVLQNMHLITSQVAINFVIWQFKIPFFYCLALVSFISFLPAIYLILKMFQEQEIMHARLEQERFITRQVEKERDGYKVQLSQILEMTSKVQYSVALDKCIRQQILNEPVKWVDLSPPSNVQLPSSKPSFSSAGTSNGLTLSRMLCNFTDGLTDAICAISSSLASVFGLKQADKTVSRSSRQTNVPLATIVPPQQHPVKPSLSKATSTVDSSSAPLPPPREEEAEEGANSDSGGSSNNGSDEPKSRYPRRSVRSNK